jgi:hypothetical protein
LADSVPFSNLQSLPVFISHGAVIPVVTHVHYNNYSNHSERIEPIFNLFLTSPDGDYSMTAVRAKTGVPITTLYSWREQVRCDPEWRPSADHFALAHRALPDDVEEIIAQFIGCQFLALGRSLNRPTLRSIVFMILHSLVVDDRLPETVLNFKCSNHFLNMDRLCRLSARGVREFLLTYETRRCYTPSGKPMTA